MRTPFNKIKLSQLYSLCRTIADAEVRDVNNIKRKYLDTGQSFDETLSLLLDLKIVRKNFNELILSESSSVTHKSFEAFKNNFLAALFSANGEISDELNNFLLNFETENDKIYFKATELQRIKFSDIRNLLLELEFIFASSDNTTYFVNSGLADIFVKQITRKKLHPESLKRKQAENELIGFSAEKAVIEYELKRLATISVSQNDIEHTSLSNVIAGYDIKSYEDYLDRNSQRIDRFIEVKAVSAANYKFYWSRTEMQIAKVFGEKYYLYLLPVDVSNNFDVEKILIIRNPYKNIFSNAQLWRKEEETISLSKVIDE